MDSKKYVELLKDPRWQKKRLEIFQRDNFTCQHCGRTNKSLQVHHLHYEKGKNPWEYENESLITLCENCHQVESESKKNLYETFKNLQDSWGKSGLSYGLLECVLNYLQWYVSKADNCEEEFNESYMRNPVKKLIEECLYGTQDYSDCVSALKLNIDMTDLIENVEPNFIDDFKKKKKEYGK